MSRVGKIALIASAILGSMLLKGAFGILARENPVSVFERYAGLQLPPTAKVAFDEREATGPFDTDGMRRIAVEVDAATLAQWQESRPFHGTCSWSFGPLKEIGQGWGLPPRELCESEQLIYALRGTASDGSVIMLDTSNKLAWLCWWY